MMIAQHLYALTDRAADQRPFDRLMVIDGSARNGSDYGAAGLTVVVTMMVVVMVMMRLCECSSGGQDERETQQCRLDLSVSH
jgi:hypothetical protein